MFDRARNILRINKLYGLLRDLKDKPESAKDIKHWNKIAQTTIEITEVKEMIEGLKGYKTYIILALTAAVNVAFMMGYIDATTRDSLLLLLGTGAAATVNAKLNDIRKNGMPVKPMSKLPDEPGGGTVNRK